jgi:hypothetical protein
MNIEKLCNFTLESCRFSKASYTFEFSGKLDSNFLTFLVSTSCYCSKSKNNDSRENFSSEIWNMLEQKLVSVSIENIDDAPIAVFTFETGESFYIWYDEQPEDNLLIITNVDTNEWSPFC